MTEHPRHCFSQIATADILTVLAGLLHRNERILHRAGWDGDVRQLLTQSFSAQLDWRKERDPELANHSPDHEVHYEAIQGLFWQMYEQAKEALRVYDDPQGEA